MGIGQGEIGVGQQRRRPIFIGDAEPGIADAAEQVALGVRIVLQRLGVVDILVGQLLQTTVADIADEAFVQDRIARNRRRAAA